MRVKVWSKDGTILYSDEPALIGKRFALGEDERRLFRTGGAQAELSDLRKPENRFERPQGKLLEAYTPIRTPNGTQVLFEIYQRFGSVSASAERLLRALAPPLLAGLLVLLLFQVPLAWSMARRLQRGHRERERLLASAVEASTQERRRIAADLHDGVVQDLAGVAFGLAPLAEDAERRGEPAEAAALRDAIGTPAPGGARPAHAARRDPPAEPRVGRPRGRRSSDLLSPLAAAGIATALDVDEASAPGQDSDALVYRVAREAIRNAQAHGGAGVGAGRGHATHAGHDAAGRGRRRPRVHGIRARAQRGGRPRRADAARGPGRRRRAGTLSRRLPAGEGTTVELEVPAG